MPKEADVTKEEMLEAMRMLSAREDYKAFPRELRERVDSVFRYWDFGQGFLDQAMVEKILAAAAVAEPMAKALWAGHLKGEIKIAHSVEVDRQYRRSDAWVVSPDGSLRPEDEDSFKGSKKFTKERGVVIWDLVDSADIALKWQGSFQGHAFTVRFQRMTPTDAQREAVAKLEDEIATNFPDAPIGRGWGLRPGAKPLPQLEKILAAIHAEQEKLECGQWKLDCPWSALCGKMGATIGHEAPDKALRMPVIGTDVSEGGSKPVPLNIVGRIGCEGGVIELLVFKYCGKMNLSARWRELKDGETAPAPELPKPQPAAKAIDATPATPEPEPVVFTHTGGRKFPCPSCGNKTELSPGKFQDVQRRIPVVITCRCGTKGVAKL